MDSATKYTTFKQAMLEELLKYINKEYVKTKVKERNEMGWGKINHTIHEAAYCEKYQQVTKLINDIETEGFCSVCYFKGEYHYLTDYPLFLYEKNMEINTISMFDIINYIRNKLPEKRELSEGMKFLKIVDLLHKYDRCNFGREKLWKK